MKLVQLRYFVTATDEGSIHRASTRLNISQPALSRQIRELEEELGAALFVRTVQGVTLSPAGEVLIEEARRLLAQCERAMSRTKRAAKGQFGTLRVGYTMIAAELRFAVSAFAELQRAQPELECRLNLINSDQQFEALANGEIDVGIMYRREPRPPELMYKDLRVDRYMLLVRCDHPLTRRPAVRLADLQGERMAFVSPRAWPATHQELMAACLKGGLTPNIALEFDRTESEAVMINLAAEGIAVSLANSTLSERGRMEGVSFLEVEDLDLPLHFAAIWRRGRETPALLHFVDYLSRHMASGKALEVDRRRTSLELAGALEF
jgi:DNA-binding transcriptional LysR family regulator